MKLLLTSGGITNDSIVQTLRGLVGKPLSEARIAVIPTGHNPEAGDKGWVVQEDFGQPYQLGWKQFSIVDLAAVATLEKDLWWPQLEESDVLLVGGGNTFYLSYWMQQCGLFDAIPKWLDSKVYIGISAGSQIAGADLRVTSEALAVSDTLTDEEYDEIGPPGQSSGKTLGLVDFTFRPHLDSPDFPKAQTNYLKDVAAKLDAPMYALDDQSALVVTNGKTEVVSEGAWHLFE
ncbi:MAG TPA: Type 1 glutamine amidotransferase-like domain-containing protein [Candidatus Saccharimonadia bacterium]|nr:Type 1 glutamine amidotransferase-like domain-containing protein [Candidatus Saccharimonadia bacterium]